MAYISQEEKKKKLLKLKPIFKKYGVRATLSIEHYSTLYLNIRESPIDFLGQYNDFVKKHNECRSYNKKIEAKDRLNIHTGAGRYMDFKEFKEKALSFLKEANKVLQEGNFDDSDSMTDYFHVGYYSSINIGNYDKGYIYNPVKKVEPVKSNNLKT